MSQFGQPPGAPKSLTFGFSTRHDNPNGTKPQTDHNIIRKTINAKVDANVKIPEPIKSHAKATLVREYGAIPIGQKPPLDNWLSQQLNRFYGGYKKRRTHRKRTRRHRSRKN